MLVVMVATVTQFCLQTQHMIKAIGTLLSFTPEEFQYVQKSIEYKVCRIMGYRYQ